MTFPKRTFTREEARELYLWLSETEYRGGTPYMLPPDLIERLMSLVGLWAQ